MESGKKNSLQVEPEAQPDATIKIHKTQIKLLFTHVDIDGALSPEYEEKAAVEPLYFTRTRVMEFSDT